MLLPMRISSYANVIFSFGITTLALLSAWDDIHLNHIFAYHF